MRHHIPDFLSHIEHDHRPRTIASYRPHLEAFADFVPDIGTGSRSPTRRDVEAFLARPRHDGARRSTSGRNQALAALKLFAVYALRNLGWTVDPTDGIAFVREPARDPVVLDVSELRRLFTATASTSRPALRSRNLAIVAVLSQDGLRVHELTNLDLRQVDLTSVTLVDVAGKGGTRHDLPMNPETAALLRAWINDRAAIAAPNEPALFVSTGGRRIAIRTVEHMFERLRIAMGTSKKLNAHSLRHSCATLSITLGTDLATVAGILRHREISTTASYVHLVDTQRRAAVARLASAIPRELLPTSPSPAIETVSTPSAGVPASSQATGSPERDPSCAEHGFDATSVPKKRRRTRSAALARTRTPTGACCVVGSTRCDPSTRT